MWEERCYRIGNIRATQFSQKQCHAAPDAGSPLSPVLITLMILVNHTLIPANLREQKH